jgi:hypothetical protein
VFQFRSIRNESDRTDFVLAFFTCFLCNSDRFEVIRDFRSLNNGGNPFPVDGSIEHRKLRHHSIPGWRFSYSLCGNFPSILFRSKVIQEFHAFEAVKKVFFSILGTNMTPKISLQISTPPKGTFLENICVD